MRHCALLVDDERLARARLRSMLVEFSQIEIVAEANNVQSALAAVEKHQPSVVFLDIQMPRQSGFEFLEKTKASFKTIFVTAHDEFAVRAFEVNGLDYLLKPIERERLAAAVQRLDRPAEVQEARPRLAESDYVLVSGAASARFIQVRSIQYIVAAGAYSEIYTAGSGKWMMLRSMKEWHERLPAKQFVRIHRSVLVNLEYVDRLERLQNYSCNVFLRNLSVPLWMSRRYAMLLRETMK